MLMKADQILQHKITTVDFLFRLQVQLRLMGESAPVPVIQRSTFQNIVRHHSRGKGTGNQMSLTLNLDFPASGKGPASPARHRAIARRVSISRCPVSPFAGRPNWIFKAWLKRLPLQEDFSTHLTAHRLSNIFARREAHSGGYRLGPFSD